MITRLSDYRTAPVVDLCIVGAGAAGLELASFLSHTPLSILLIESGYEQYDWRVQRLCRINQIGRPSRSADHDRWFGLEEAAKKEARLRQFGGTLNIWGGRWKTFDPYDLSQKPYFPESGWPLDYEELYAYYHQIADQYNISELMQYDKPAALPLLDYPCFSMGAYLTQGVKIDIRQVFQKPLEKSRNVNIILGANVVDIKLSAHLKQVDHLLVRSLEGEESEVRAKCVVMACGTIENARLLLCANKQIKDGIGNHSGWVGRNLIDHLKGRAYLNLFPEHQAIDSFTHMIEDKKICFDLKIHEEQLKEWELPNHSLWLLNLQKVKGRLACKCRLVLEQLPNPESRILLSDKRDDLGLPIACVDWKLRELDQACYRRFAERMNHFLTANKIGTLSCYDMEDFRDCSHQMGTTRMAADPKDGVVDKQCKVFGLDNLYILGSSVFPTGGNANPTFTVLALSRRLGEHLKGRLAAADSQG